MSLAVLSFYINAMGGKWKFGLLMSWFLLVEAARVGATVWLSHWTDTVDTPGGAPHGALWYLMIYTIISAVQVSNAPSSLQAALLASAALHSLQDDLSHPGDAVGGQHASRASGRVACAPQMLAQQAPAHCCLECAS